jgi:FtsH-binding integral membrane protein
MKAPLPSAIRCPHCRKKIRVLGVVPYLVVYLLVVIALAAWLIVARRHNVISSAAVIVIAAVALGFLEFVISMIVLRYAKFAKPGA